MAWRIARWTELYQPTRERDNLEAPLRFVKLAVYGHSLSESYRLLFATDPETAPAAFGLFTKLLEIAADEPRERRDGTIRFRGGPATVRHIALMSLFPEPLAERCLELLSTPDIGWIESDAGATASPRCSTDAAAVQPRDSAAPSPQRDDGESTRLGHVSMAQWCAPRAETAEARTHSAPSMRRSRCIQPTTETETEREPEGNRNGAAHHPRCGGTPRVRPPDRPPAESPPAAGGPAPADNSVSASAARSGPSVSEAVHAIAGKTAQLCAVALKVRATRQGRHDVVTLRRAIDHALAGCPTVEDAEETAQDLLALAREKGKSSLDNPIAGWIAAFKRSWGSWPEAAGRREAS